MQHGLPGILIKPSINPLSGDSFSVSSAGLPGFWFKKQSLAAMYVPRFEVVRAPQLPLAPGQATWFALRLHNPSLLPHTPVESEVRVRLSLVDERAAEVPVDAASSAEGAGAAAAAAASAASAADAEATDSAGGLPSPGTAASATAASGTDESRVGSLRVQRLLVSPAGWTDPDPAAADPACVVVSRPLLHMSAC